METFDMNKKQSDVPRLFDGNSTALQILHGKDLRGKVGLITGSNSGIGYETARSLALHNCEVIFGCRNEKLALEAINKIKDEKSDAKCVFIKLDLSTLKSTKVFCETVQKKYKHIDYLILNAGLFPPKYAISPENIEFSFQVSHLSHFYLTLELSELLNEHSRVVVVSSEAHLWSMLPSNNWSEDLLNPSYCSYWRLLVYSNVKLCNILFARELSKKWKDRGISVFSLHPGRLMATNFANNFWFNRMLFGIVKPFTKSLEQGAATTVYAATAPELAGCTGYYLTNCYFCEESRKAKSDRLAVQLWEISEEMVHRIMGSSKIL